MVSNVQTSDVIEFQGNIYAYLPLKKELWQYNAISGIWGQILSSPEGLLVTEKGFLLEESCQRQHNQCSCSSSILFSHGCQCGGN